MRDSKGFTLIELLVTISIISLLSSVVFTALSGAKSKAKDAAVKTEVGELTKIMDMEYNDKGSYCNLQNGWIPSSYSCQDTASDLSSYATQARAICNNILKNAGKIDGSEHWGSNNQIIYNIVDVANGLSCNTAYTIMVSLNNGKWYCSGSSGRKGEYDSYYGSPGCYNNP